MKVVLRAAFDMWSGYGRDAVDLAVALDKAGVDVTPHPTALIPGLPRAFTKLLEKDPRGRKDIVLTFGPPDMLRPWETTGKGTVHAGYTMWERTPFLASDFSPEWDGHDHGWADYDRLFVTCPMNVEAFAPWLDPTRPAKVIPCGIDPDAWPVVRRDLDRPMKVIMVGMLAGRKDPFALLRTWRRLKADVPEFDATLQLHTLAPGLHPAISDTMPDLTITNQPLSHEQLVGLYHSADLLVSTSRGEGNNKPAMEFLATGGAVAATAWGGHLNWLDPSCTFGLRGALEPAWGAPDAQEYGVDEDHLYDVLLWSWAQRVQLRDMGDRGARHIRSSHSWESVAGRFKRELAGLL